MWRISKAPERRDRSPHLLFRHITRVGERPRATNGVHDRPELLQTTLENRAPNQSRLCLATRSHHVNQGQRRLPLSEIIPEILPGV